MTVIAVCPSDRVDSESAVRDYGPVWYVNSRFVYGDEIDGERLPPEFQGNIERAALWFDPERDYVLIGGDYVQLVALIEALTRVGKKFRALRWDKKAEGYLTVWFGTIEQARVHDLTPTR